MVKKPSKVKTSLSGEPWTVISGNWYGWRKPPPGKEFFAPYRLNPSKKYMSIIISQNGKNAVRVDRSDFDKEDYLQQYIHDNPESIPLYEIKEDIRLLILAREFPTASGPIDAIGIDREGELYVVETKLYKNADKRKVIAQALDYGASLWKHSNDFNEFLGILDEQTQKAFKLRTADKIGEFFGLEKEEVDVIIDKARANLNNGVFHFVILMDRLDDRLKDLILYVNQNSQFDIYAVEFEYYKHESHEIIIPKIFGTEVKKDILVNSSSRQKWTEATLLEDARTKLSAEEFSAFQKMYDFSKKHANQINFGTGAYASFSPIFNSLSDKSLFSLSTSPNYSFGLNFEWVAKNGREDTAKLFRDKIVSLGFTISDDYLSLRPSLGVEEWAPKVDDILKILREMLGR